VDREKSFIIFSILAVTGPILGVVVGGQVISALGGYNDSRAQVCTLVVCLVANVAGLPMPVFSNIKVIAGLLWI